MTAEERQALKARCAAAKRNLGADLQFITHAYQDIPALCDALDAAEAEIARLRATYVPQHIAQECIATLEGVGFGAPGQPNTLLAMAQNAVQEIAHLRAESDRLRAELAAVAGSSPASQVDGTSWRWSDGRECQAEGDGVFCEHGESVEYCDICKSKIYAVEPLRPCADCGRPLQEVRPGDWRCPHECVGGE